MEGIIKFRAWDGEKMVLADYVGKFGQACWVENSVPTYSDKVMQFTGLYDKNNREIYEEDICIGYYPGAEQKYVNKILFHNGSFMFAGEPIGYWDDIEVIGNIYENPELLDD